jgi:hypothetical protein
MLGLLILFLSSALEVGPARQKERDEQQIHKCMKQKTWNSRQALWSSHPIAKDPTRRLEREGASDHRER